MCESKVLGHSHSLRRGLICEPKKEWGATTKRYWLPSFKKKEELCHASSPKVSQLLISFHKITLLLPDVWVWRRWRTSSACGGGGDVVPPTTPIGCLNDHKTNGLATLGSVWKCHLSPFWFTKLTRYPETNSKFAPRNGWLEYDPFLLGPSAYFHGQNCC